MFSTFSFFLENLLFFAYFIQMRPVEHKAALKRLKDKQKIRQRTYKLEIKALEKAIPEAEIAVKLLTNKGKLELILEDPNLVATLKERWIAAEAAKRPPR